MALLRKALSASGCHGSLGLSGNYKRSKVSPKPEKYRPGDDPRAGSEAQEISWGPWRLADVQWLDNATGHDRAAGLEVGSLGRALSVCMQKQDPSNPADALGPPFDHHSWPFLEST